MTLMPPASFLLLLLLSGVFGSFGAVIYNVNARSLAQSITPERMLGRTIATLRFAVWGTILWGPSSAGSWEAGSG
jgi:hypothetical protein